MKHKRLLLPVTLTLAALTAALLSSRLPSLLSKGRQHASPLTKGGQRGVIQNPKSKIENLPLPLLTLLAPGHYVLIERVTPAEITTWDPNANGLGKPGVKTYPLTQWTQLWPGQTLALR